MKNRNLQKVMEYDKKHRKAKQPEAIGFSIYDEKNLRIIDDVCKTIENSVKPGIDLDKAIDIFLELLDRRMSQSKQLFIHTYIQKYKEDAAYRTRVHRQAAQKNKTGGTYQTANRTVNNSDHDALRDIYDRYLERQKNKKDRDGDGR